MLLIISLSKNFAIDLSIAHSFIQELHDMFYDMALLVEEQVNKITFYLAAST
jgi:hypothetical protein